MSAASLRLALVAGLAGLAAAAAVRAQEAPRLDWQVARAQGQVQLTLSYRTEHGSSSTGRTTSLAELAGLSDAQLASPSLSTVRFRLHRDAGDFDCDGSARAERASGTCDFRANPAFLGVLKAHGVAGGDPSDLFPLAYADIGTAYLDELARQKYPVPDVDDLRRAGQHGVSLAYLRDMGGAGYRADSLGELVRLRDHGVSLRYVQALKDAGYGRLPIEDVVRSRDHGVSPQFIAALAQEGYKGLPLETLVRMRDHGVTATFANRANAQAADAGRRLTPDELIRLRDTGALYARSGDRDRDRDR